MKWTLIVLLSLFGAGVGIFSLFGYTAGIELILWTAIALIVAFSVARTTTHKVFLHGLLIGIGAGVMYTLPQISFFGMFVAHNRMAAEELHRFSNGISPQAFILLSGPVVGVVYGMVIGTLSAAASRFHHPK